MALPKKTPVKKLEFQHFDLDKVKRPKDGLSVRYYEKGAESTKHTVEIVGTPHPHFEAALDALKQYFAMTFGILGGWDFARENLRDKDDELREAVIGYNREVDRVTIVGISFLGDAETRGVKIHGSLKCEGGFTKADTPKIPFAGEKLGYEQTVQALCEKIREETYLYVFSGKRAQEDLFKQAEEADENNGLFEDGDNDEDNQD